MAPAPRIDCSERAPAEPLPPALPRLPAAPGAGAGRSDWLRHLSRRDAVWTGLVVRSFGAYESLASQRSVTAECLDAERDAGRIR